MEMRPETEACIHRILDVFTGADGGGSFMDFRTFVETMDQRASEGDKAAEELISIVRRFSRLLDTAERLSREHHGRL